MDIMSKIREKFSHNSSTSSDILKINTLIGKKTSVEGNLEIKGNVKIDGEVSGPITANGDVVIGKSATVRGDIFARNVIIAGDVEGNVSASGQLSIKSTANVKGEHTAFSLIVDEGSVFTGNCNILDSKANAEKECTNNQQIE